MSMVPSDPQHSAITGPQQHTAPPDDFDPATAELSSALRKSFRVLKVVMFILIGLYFLSGAFSVKSGESGVVLRFGQIVGVGTPDAVKAPGWHWSLPFPIDQWQTLPTSERELDVEFMLELSPEERATGKIQPKFNNLYPDRDDYLVTGDINILHATLKIKYRIEDVVQYVTNVLPMPRPRADVKDPPSHHYPEYTLLRSLARDAVISTAASFGALDIRGSRQDEFLVAVGKCLNRKLKQLADGGAPIGIHVDENSGVIATKSKTGTLEAIMPPRQTQEVFDQVFTAQTNKVVAITQAASESESMLVNTAGPDYAALSDSIDAEYDLMRRLSAAADGENTQALEAELAAQREKTEALLQVASGEIRSLIKNAEIERDSVIKEASGDYSRYAAVLPEYLRHKEIFLSRLVDEARGRALADADVTKVYVPEKARQYRLQIPRSGSALKTAQEKQKEAERERKANVGKIPRPKLR